MVKFTFFPNTDEVAIYADDILLGTYNSKELVKDLGQGYIIAAKQHKLNDVDSSKYQLLNE